MDTLLHAAASALAVGNPLRALNCVALRDDSAGLALRGIAIAQLGDLALAQTLLKRAARGFVKRAPLAQARCILAQAEIAFVSRDLGWSEQALESARLVLEQAGEVLNAVHARHLQARKFLLLGQLKQAESVLVGVNPAALPPRYQAAHEMILAGLAIQRFELTAAEAAYTRAWQAVQQVSIPALQAEVRQAQQRLQVPAARWFSQGQQHLLLLAQVHTLLSSGTLVVDACRRVLCQGRVGVPLASRPVLLALARALALAWPQAAPRTALLQAAFQAKRVDDSHRARLRVEMGRLRQLLRPLADVRATPEGFVLLPRHAAQAGVLTWPEEDEHGAVLAFLADGEAWSSSALALALGVSQRTVQRALDALVATGKVQWFGRGRARRWLSSTVPGFTTTMLLPSFLPTA